MDLTLVLLFGGAGVWVVRQRIPKVNVPLKVWAVVGIVLGMTHLAHHALEFFTLWG